MSVDERGGRRALPWAILTAVAAFAVYAPTFSASFLAFDDYETVADAPLLPLSRIWTGVVFKTWLPVTFTSLRIDQALFGTGSAFGYRVENALLHALNSLVVLFLARRLLGTGVAAAAAALVFALHPAAAESVAWVSERKGLLAFLFGGLSMLVFLRACGRAGAGRAGLLAGATALLALALLAKGSALVVPLLLAVLVLAGLAPGARWRDLAPLAAATVAITLVHYLVALREGPARAAGGGDVLPLLATDVVVLARYLRVLFLPAWGLSIVPDVRPDAGLSAARLLPALGVLAAMSAALFVAWRRDRRVFAGLACVVVALSPFNNLFPRTDVLFAERYLYFSIAFAAVAAAALLSRAGRLAAPALACAVAATGVLGVLRSAVYADDVGLFRDAAAKAEGSWLAPMKLGDALKMRAARGGIADPLAIRALIAEAATQFRKALPAARTPEEELRSRVDLAGSLLVLGEAAEALAAAEPAVPLLARVSSVARGALTLEVELNRGAALLLLDRAGEAVDAYRAASAAAPRDARPLAGLSAALARSGDGDGAVAAAREAAALDGTDEGAAIALAEALLLTGADAEAKARLSALVAVRPSAVRARVLLGQLSLSSGRPREAKKEFSEVLSRVKDHADARRGMAEADLMLARGARSRGATAEARDLARSAVAQDASCPGAIVFLASLTEDAAEAERLLAAAIELPDGGAAREALAARRLAPGFAAARAKDARAAAEAVAAAVRLKPGRLRGPGGVEESGLMLSEIAAVAGGPQAPGRDTALAGFLAALAGENPLAEELLSAAFTDATNGGAPAVARVALLLRGRARAAAGDARGAAEDLSFAAERDATDFLAPLLLAEALRRAAADASARGEPVEATLAAARDAATEAVKRAPARMEPLLALGEVDFAAGRYLDALRSMNRAKKEHPDRVEPRLDLCALYKANFVLSEDKDLLRGALDEAGEALRLDPGNARARAAVGEVLLLAGQAKRAASELARAVAEDPSLTGARATLAGLYVHSGRSRLEQGGAEGADEAAEFAQLALALATRDAGPHLLLADVARARKDFAKALTHLAEARALSPDSDEVKDAAARYHMDLGYAFLLRGQKERAMEEFRRAVDAGSKNTDLAQVRVLLGLDAPAGGDAAESPLDGVLKERTETAKRHFDEAGRLLAAGDAPGAEKEILASLAARRTAEGLCRYGEILAAGGRDEEALKALASAVELKGGLHQAWFALGNLRYRRGELAEAMAAYDRWLAAVGDAVPEEAKGAIRARVDEMRAKLAAEGK